MPFEILDDEAPAAAAGGYEILDEETPGRWEGAARALQRGVKGMGAILPTTLTAGMGNQQPTMRQERRGFIRAMEDPAYMAGLTAAGDDAGAMFRAESLFGPQRRVEEQTASAKAIRDIWTGVAAEIQGEIAAVPKSKAQAELAAAVSSADKWQVFKKYPGQVLSSIVLESLPPSIGGAVVGGATGGPAGMAAGAGLASGAQTFSSEFLNGAVKAGFNPTDEQQLAAFLDSPAYEKAFSDALTKASIVGSIDAGTAGAAGIFVKPALKEGLWSVIKASGLELTMQAFGGATGEFLGQAATKGDNEPFDWFDIAMEAAAEFATGPSEVISNVRSELKSGGGFELLDQPTDNPQQSEIERALNATPNVDDGPDVDDLKGLEAAMRGNQLKPKAVSVSTKPAAGAAEIVMADLPEPARAQLTRRMEQGPATPESLPAPEKPAATGAASVDWNPTEEMRAALEFQKRTDEAVKAAIENPDKEYEAMTRQELELLEALGDGRATAQLRRLQREQARGAELKVESQPPEPQGQVITGDAFRAALKANGGDFPATDSQIIVGPVRKALEAGREVILTAEGKRVKIVGIEAGMLTDAKGQRWGSMTLATGKDPAQNNIAISPGQTTAPAMDLQAAMAAQVEPGGTANAPAQAVGAGFEPVVEPGGTAVEQKPAKPAKAPKPPKPPTEAAIRRQAANEFDKLLLEHGMQAGWVRKPEVLSDDTLNVKTGHGTASVKARILRSQEMAGVRRRAAQELGFERYDDIGKPENRAVLLPRLKEWIAQNMATPEQQAAAFQQAASKGPVNVPTESLKVGDALTIDGEPLRVVEVTPEGEVVLQDGKRFGQQVLTDGTTIYAEDWQSAPDETAGQLPEQATVKESLPVEQKATEEAKLAAVKAVLPKHKLTKPIAGTTGAKIIGYEWRSTMGEKWSEREGGYVDARVSDWDNADESKGTGRQIVHVYFVEHPDGRVTTEGIRSAQNVIGISESRLQAIAKKAQAEQSYAAEQERLHFEALESTAEPTPAEASKKYRKANWSNFRTFEENEEIFNRSKLFEKDGRYVRTSTGPERMAERGWKPYDSFAQESSEPAATPTIKAGQKQGDLLGSGDIPFNLFSEQTQSGERIEAKRRQREETERAAKEFEAKNQPDLIESALDKLKIETPPGSLQAFGLLPETWNTAVEMVRVGYRAGKSIEQSIEEVIDWLYKQGHRINELLIRAKLMQLQKVRNAVEQSKQERMDGIYVQEHTDDDTGDPSWIVGHQDAGASWFVYKWEGGWIGESNGSIVRGRTRDEAIEEAKDRLRDEIGDNRTTFGGNIDNMYEIAPLFADFELPYGAKETGWERTKWGSWYNTVTMEGGESYKLSVRDHDASRKDLGLPDKSAFVSKEWNPKEVQEALERLELWLDTVSRQIQSEAWHPPVHESTATPPGSGGRQLIQRQPKPTETHTGRLQKASSPSRAEERNSTLTGGSGARTSSLLANVASAERTRSASAGVAERLTQAAPSAVQPAPAQNAAVQSTGQRALKAQSKDAIESALDKLKIETPPGLQAFGLLPETWNQLIEIVRKAYRAGKTIAAAIDDGVAWLRKNVQDFDEAAIKDELRQVVGGAEARPEDTLASQLEDLQQRLERLELNIIRTRRKGKAQTVRALLDERAKLQEEFNRLRYGAEKEATAVEGADATPAPMPEFTQSQLDKVSSATLDGAPSAESFWTRVRKGLRYFATSTPEIAVTGDEATNAAMFRRGVRLFGVETQNARRTAAREINKVLEPIKALGRDVTNPDAVNQFFKLGKRIRREEGRANPNEDKLAEWRAKQTRVREGLEKNPWYLFQQAVLWRDLWYRGKFLRTPSGGEITLPGGLEIDQVERAMQRNQQLIDANPNGAAVRESLKRHYALMGELQESLLKHGELIPDELRNPLYFPHHLLEKFTGSLERARPTTEKDFRAYLIAPVGSEKLIEAGYINALYKHVNDVTVHNARADVVEKYWRPYDKAAERQQELEEEAAERGETVHPDAWKRNLPPGMDLFTPSEEIPMRADYILNRGELAKALGVALPANGDLRNALVELGAEVRLTGDMIQKALVAGERPQWLLPMEIAEAIRGVVRREEARSADTIGRRVGHVLSKPLQWWKGNTLFNWYNYPRYEWGNTITDVIDKMLGADPGMARYLGRALKEVRDAARGQRTEEFDSAEREGVLQSITAAEVEELARLPEFEDFLTSKQWRMEKVRKFITWTARASAVRESTFRYAKFLADLERIRRGEQPVYAGAYWRDVQAARTPEAKAAEIALKTFGDYGNLSVVGNFLREHVIPFWSWQEINLKYHANLFRNLHDMLTLPVGERPQGARDAARAAALGTATFTARAAVGIALRLALMRLGVELWNQMGGAWAGLWDDDEDLEGQLSEADRRRFHLILGKDENGRVRVVYVPNALSDVAEWFGGNNFARLFTEWAKGDIPFGQFASDYGKQLPSDLVNKVVQGARPDVKFAYMATSGKDPFPDVTNQRDISRENLGWLLMQTVTDRDAATFLRQQLDKDFYAPEDLGDWLGRKLLQIRRRDPEQWAYYEIRDRAADWKEARTGKRNEGLDYQSPDQQVIRNFRKAIYRGDMENAVRFYHRLRDYGYTDKRFAASIRNSDPLSDLTKLERREFERGLTGYERELLTRAKRYYGRLAASKGREKTLFPSNERSTRRASEEQIRRAVGQ